MRLAVLPLAFAVGVAVAACGGHTTASSRHEATFQSVITRVIGTRTVVQTVTTHLQNDVGPTTPAPDARTMAELVQTGYYVCRHVPASLVHAAPTDPAARRHLAMDVLRRLAAHGSRRELPALLTGCLRQLKLRALPTTASA